MKLRVTVTTGGKAISGEKEIRAKDHLTAQIKFPHLVQRNRVKYTRKIKHKNRKEMENENG